MEKKFLIDQIQYYRCSGRLAQVMSTDPHDPGSGYRIRSLYFDTLDDQDFQEKEDGVELRRKLRLRNYGPDSSFALLEMKQKEGPRQKKRSLRMSREAAGRLLRGDYGVLLDSGDPFAAECYALMRTRCYVPRSVVEYRRRAFIAKENKTRVTFDRQIIGTEAGFDIFDPQLLQYPVLDPQLTVLEVKYNGFLLGYVKDLLTSCSAGELSIGKYSLSRTVGKHYRY